MEQLRLSGKSVLLLLMVFLALGAKAQDPTFSQFYLNKTYLNPAYAGYTKDLSLGFQSRYQWTHIPGVFLTTTASLNVGSPGTRLGYGVQLYNNVEGEGRLMTQSGCLQVSYNLPGRFGRGMGKKMYGKKYILSFGMQGAVSQKSIDWSKFTFTDQLDPYDGLVKQNTSLQLGKETSNIIYDLSAGLRYRAEFDRKGSYVSLGTAIFHLNQPKESFFDFESTLDPRYTVHAFVHFQTKKYQNNPLYLSVGYVFDKQQVLQTNTMYLAKDINKAITLGVAFRRKEVFNVDHNNDSFIMQFTYSKKGLMVGYSYDITVSSLGVYNTYGTHEVGIIYTFDGVGFKKSNKRKDKHEDCFYMNNKYGKTMKP